MLKTILLMLLCFTVASVVIGCDGKSQQPLSSEELVQFQACTTADDCVYANNGCCNCANGGEAIAVNVDQAGNFADEFDCFDVPCTLAEAEPACNVGTTSCENNLCKFTRP